MRISDWSSDVCSSDLPSAGARRLVSYPLLFPGRTATRIGPKMSVHSEPFPSVRPRYPVQPSSHRVCPSARRLRARYFGDRGVQDTIWPEIGRAQSELQSLMRNSYAVLCLKKKNNPIIYTCT